MSSLWRFIYSKGVNRKLTFLKSKGTNVCNVARCNASSVQKSEKPDKYATLKPWISYGFDWKDKATDRHYMHTIFFAYITVLIIWGGTAMYFFPDPHLRNWARREAYIQLRYREENGLPPIDPNFIDPSLFTLPSDEELGYTKIIV
ncbi:NADH dehydrogenase [ubiquinone] 1 beta subcomplex subunit NP15.6 [Xylocopa sonorina]|uniref:NADH dehydrogenase [ubiquinone] 1 beta subcomplex subunit NP15.6 n=1 Tax=Xylocopa sonorina TaxID=1818115 RepID=UPI00403AE81D